MPCVRFCAWRGVHRHKADWALPELCSELEGREAGQGRGKVPSVGAGVSQGGGLHSEGSMACSLERSANGIGKTR